MRNRWQYFRPLLDYLGLLLWVFGFLMLVPLAVMVAFARAGRAEVPACTFVAPAAIALLLGAALKRDRKFPPLDNRLAMILCSVGWIVVSAVGALPFCLALGVGPLDAYLETVSGFTTTGITMLGGLDRMPHSILFWRSFIQWLGGAGILTFFLAILYTGGSAHWLFGAESHKAFAKRPAPGLISTLRILWAIYACLTVVVTLLLILEGMSVFDGACHGMTALATGGYSPHDASIGYYRQAGYRHYVLIEYTIIFGMIAGGISFLAHYRLFRGELRALWDSMEMRLWWILLAGATALLTVEELRRGAPPGCSVHETFRASLFQVTSLLTTTGFATRDIATEYPPASKQVFLVLMVIGGCVGSTAGGFKVLRIGVLGKLVQRLLRKFTYGSSAVHPVVVDGEVVETEELQRIAGLFFAWVALVAFGGVVTAMLSGHDALASASGMFSAVGNFGPSYIPMARMVELHPLIKIVYILGMLAGRLEVLPVLLLFSRRTWR